MPSGASIRTVVNLDLIVADSVARPLLQNFKQFNGKYGCSYCLHEGTQVDKGQGTVRTFPLTAALPNLRTHNQTLKFAEEAENTGSDVFGVKGISVLYSIPRFDIVNGLNPEYMHCILLGVVRQFANLWFDAASHGKTFSLRKELSHIDNVLLKVKPPSEIKRLPRSLVTRCHWKASEWRSFLLFYSVVALKPVMPSQFYTHWLLLVYSVYTLMSKHVKRSDLLLCDLALHNFVILVPDLYGPEHVSYNVHLLQHIVKSVEQWGPLWASSAFVFEDANRMLLRWFHGTTGVSRQIFKYYIASKHLHPLAERYVKTTSDKAVCDLFSRFSHIKVPCENVTRFSDNSLGLGIGRNINLSASQTLAVESLLNSPLANTDNASITVNSFDRVLVNGVVLHTLQYSAAIKRCDSYFTLHNHTGVFALQNCINLSGTKDLILIFSHFKTQQLRSYDTDVQTNLLSHVFRVHRGGFQHIVACQVTDLAHKCICVKDKNGKQFCTALPVFELD